ncbi:MAG: hypothetical protein JJ896_14550 [Rhodothermales bacterium]|nr:hypothetical protein [Rhodothermales bacterium]MBO6780871.1 hypothetical protein [Rhodothermales bacterium]
MESKTSRLIARLFWIVPLALAALTTQQAMVYQNLGATLTNGEAAQAEVLRYFRSDRKDVTHAEIDLRVVLEDGTERTWQQLALPYSIAHRVDNSDSLAVRVNLGAPQEVVITEIGRTQRSIALSNMAMALVAFLITLVGAIEWNRQVGRAGSATAGTALP